MAYIKQHWENEPSTVSPINAERLSHLETQYDQARDTFKLDELVREVGRVLYVDSTSFVNLTDPAVDLPVVAVGTGLSAEGSQIIFGRNNDVKGSSHLVVGVGNTVDSVAKSVFGSDNTLAGGSNGVFIGEGLVASNSYGGPVWVGKDIEQTGGGNHVVLGYGIEVNTSEGVVIGKGISHLYGGNVIAIGWGGFETPIDPTAGGGDTVFIGFKHDFPYARANVNIGVNNTLSPGGGYLIGSRNSADADGIAVGTENTVSPAGVAIGGYNSAAEGVGGGVMIGEGNEITNSTGTAIGVGNKTSDGGHIFGSYNEITMGGLLAIGSNSKARAGGMAYGFSADAENGGMAFGYYAKATDGSIAFSAEALHSGSVAFSARSTADSQFAVGYRHIELGANVPDLPDAGAARLYTDGTDFFFANSSTVFNLSSGGGGGGSLDRYTLIEPGATGNLTVDVGADSFSLVSLEASGACRVRGYRSSANRATDSGRSPGDPPAFQGLVLFEFIFTGANTYWSTGYKCFLEDSDTDLYLAVDGTVDLEIVIER